MTDPPPNSFLLSARPHPDSVKIGTSDGVISLTEHDYLLNETHVRLNDRGVAIVRWLGERKLLHGGVVAIRYTVEGESAPARTSCS